MPHPFVYWAQTEEKVTLKVVVTDAQQPQVSFSDEGGVSFATVGHGHQGSREYQFEMFMHRPILPSDCSVKVTASNVLITIVKTDLEWWPRLTLDEQRRPWLRIDFDRWKSGEEEEENEEEFDNDAMKRYEEMEAERMVSEMMRNIDAESFKWPDFQNMKKHYLLLYNVLLFVGYLAIVVEMSYKYSVHGTDYFRFVWVEVYPRMMCCVLAQWLEVLHAVFRFTRTSPAAAFLQVGGRSLLLFCVLAGEVRMQQKPFVFYVFMVYSMIELFRYPYYALATVGKDWYFVTWLRYTMWIPLYPAGFICEGTILLRCIPYFDETRKFSIPLPNSLNFGFDFASFIRVFLFLGFAPTILFLIHYMRKQRYSKIVAPYVTVPRKVKAA